MNVIPSIDLLEGRVVRLRRGDFNDVTDYSCSPLEIIKQYEKAGFSNIHIVDLSSAKNGFIDAEKSNLNFVNKNAIKIQYGGGIRKLEDIEYLFTKGIDSVVIGSLAAEYPALVNNWIQQFGVERIILAIDIRLINEVPLVMTQGWQKEMKVSLTELLEFYKKNENLKVLCTDIDRDGLLQGTNISLYESLVKSYPNVRWIASGGVNNYQDLSGLNNVGIKNVIVGKALYEKRITIKECKEARKW